MKVRAERIWKDIKVKGLRKEENADSLREIIDEVKKREESEKKRYKEYYDVDPYDRTNYDLVIDTTYTTAEQALAKIVEFVEKTNSQQ